VALSGVAAGLELATARLLLRPPRREDFDDWASFAADAEATRFLGGPQPRAVAWRAFGLMAGSWALYGFGMFSVLERATGRWIGRVGPWRPDGWPGNEIGWGLLPEVAGRGYATEAASATIDWALAALGWDDFIHCIAADNHRSVALAERLGSRWQRRARMPAPIGTEIEVYGQSAAQWRARAAQAGGLPR
jgi:RimJ/RimL family protein N-acetyltransferase